MQINGPTSGYPLPPVNQQPSIPAEAERLEQQASAEDGELREVFDEFVGRTFYSQMLGAMRKSVGKPAYFHGGRGEEVFQSQLDQVLSERLADATAETFTGPMFELFSMNLERR